MAEAHDWFDPNAQNLDPALLQAIMGVQAQADPSGNGLMRYYVDPKTGRSFLARAGWDQNGTGDAGGFSGGTASNWGINEDLGGRYGRAFDAQGKYAGNYKSQGPWQDFLTAAAIALGGYYGGTYLNGAEGAVGGAEGLSGMDLAADAAAGTGNSIGTAGSALSGSAGATGVSGMDLAGDAAAGTGNNITTAGQGLTGTAGTAGTSAATKAGTTAATTGGTATSGGTSTAGTAATAGKGLMDIFKADGTLDYAKIGAGLLGAYAGYQDGKDKQATTKIEPWDKAQPYLEGLLRDGATLYDQYRQQPFSPSEQTAYGNFGNVLDVINGNAGGLLSGFQAAGSGRNNFTRGKPSLLTGYGFEPTGEQWRPGLLGNFGTTPIPRGAK